mmetsp:Transcript_4928/g.13768  ORF Transcript_4928/g.13768 Transcript_4928/m.13768 type:complete len:203 (+) Transcript_4928:185-793(+)
MQESLRSPNGDVGCAGCSGGPSGQHDSREISCTLLQHDVELFEGALELVRKLLLLRLGKSAFLGMRLFRCPEQACKYTATKVHGVLLVPRDLCPQDGAIGKVCHEVLTGTHELLEFVNTGLFHVLEAEAILLGSTLKLIPGTSCSTGTDGHHVQVAVVPSHPAQLHVSLKAHKLIPLGLVQLLHGAHVCPHLCTPSLGEGDS